MGLTSWKGKVVRKGDVVVAKNYLNNDELDSLNRLVMIFLESAELRVKKQKDLTLAFWRNNVDSLLEFNGFPVLEGLGDYSHKQMEQLAHQEYEKFNYSRKQLKQMLADAEDLKELEELNKTFEKL